MSAKGSFFTTNLRGLDLGVLFEDALGHVGRVVERYPHMTRLAGRLERGDALEGAAEGLYMMLPAIIFLVALGLAFATGTSWGTFGILIPIVIAVFDPTTQPTLMTIGLSACLAGAVCGDHISPISDTTIMASAGANVNHIEHVSTQIPYALTVAGISFVMFIIAGFVQNAVICLAVGIALTIVVLIVLRNTIGKKSIEERKAIDAAAAKTE
jgi:hypothetical protein